MDNQLEFQVRINYKSGHQHTSWFKQFSVEKQSGKIIGIKWLESDANRLMFIDVDSIESVTQL